MQRILNIFNFFGIDIRRGITNLRNFNWYLSDYRLLKKQGVSSKAFSIKANYPILYDKKDAAGTSSGHYFHQDLLIAQRIFTNNPVRHIDVGSRIDGFIAHVASFRNIEVLDIREIPHSITNVTFRQADLMNLPNDLISACDSLSCLHALEHFGLGRYGDPIDFFGYEKGLNNMIALLKTGGIFYFSTPMGPQRIEFNAHRVFALRFLINLLTPQFDIISFSYVDDAGDLHQNISLADKTAVDGNFGCSYGCAIFELKKK